MKNRYKICKIQCQNTKHLLNRLNEDCFDRWIVGLLPDCMMMDLLMVCVGTLGLIQHKPISHLVKGKTNKATF